MGNENKAITEVTFKARLWPRSTPMIYFQSTLLFLHDNTLCCINMKSGPSHLFFCQQLIYMYSTDYTREAGEFYFHTMYKKTFQVMFTFADTQLCKKSMKGRKALDKSPSDTRKLRWYWRDKRPPATIQTALFYMVSKELLQRHNTQGEVQLKIKNKKK